VAAKLTAWAAAAAAADSRVPGSGGAERPYEVLELGRAASQGEIRKAYRKLSLQLHPDKNPGCDDAARDAFAEVVAAYETLSSPDKRQAFDDYGGDHYETFSSEYEYHTYGDKNERDFYTGHPLITTISAERWRTGLAAEPPDRVWLIEFYAPWCGGCQKFASGWKETAVALADDDIEVGGINCAKDRDMCQKTFNIRSYPTVRLLNRHYGTMQEFDSSTPKTADAIAAWARAVHAEWRWLFARSQLQALTAGDFEAGGVVAGSEEFWAVLLLDGLECGPCKTAKTNMLRLSAGLAPGGLGRVGFLDCQPPEHRALCTRIGVPAPPHAPQVRGWQRGPKASGAPGEALYNANELEPHLALQLIEVAIRLSHAPPPADAADAETGVATPGSEEAGWDKGERPPPPPPPPPPQRPTPMWSGPRGRQPLNLPGGSGLNRKAIGG
jgi:thiol-disulfide isomerase/thioredoxin